MASAPAIDHSPLQQALQKLPPIALPEPPSVWPPAPGWWIVAALILAGIVAVVYRVRHYRSITAARRAAIIELEQLRTGQSKLQDTHAFFASCAQLLRRFALTLPNGKDLVGQSPEVFIDELNALVKKSNDNIIDRRSTALLQQHYLPVDHTDADASHVADTEHLYRQLKQWLNAIDHKTLNASRRDDNRQRQGPVG